MPEGLVRQALFLWLLGAIQIAITPKRGLHSTVAMADAYG